MSRGLSLDLRARAVALIAGGMSRRAAARHLMFAESSAIKWFKRFKETGSYAEKPGRKTQHSPLDKHADWLLALVKSEPDLTLAQIVVRLLDGRGLETSDSSLCRFFQRRDITFKKNSARQRAASRGRGEGARGMEGGPAGT